MQDLIQFSVASVFLCFLCFTSISIPSLPHPRKEFRNIKGKSRKNLQFITAAYLKEQTAAMDSCISFPTAFSLKP